MESRKYMVYDLSVAGGGMVHWDPQSQNLPVILVSRFWTAPARRPRPLTVAEGPSLNQ